MGICRRWWWTSLYSASEDSATFQISLSFLPMEVLKLSKPVRFFTLSSIPPWISTVLPISSRTSKSPSSVSRNPVLTLPWNAPISMVVFPFGFSLPLSLSFDFFLFFLFSVICRPEEAVHGGLQNCALDHSRFLSMGDPYRFSLHEPILSASDSQTWRELPSLSSRDSAFSNCNFHLSTSLFSSLRLCILKI